jgi:iron(III) transport system permease protein
VIRAFCARPDLPFLERKGRAFYWLSLIFLLTVSALSGFAILRASFMPAGGYDPWHAVTELARPSVMRATWNSISTSLVSALISVALGGVAALLVAVTDMRAKRAFAFLFAMSMLVAPHVAALAFKTLLGPASPVLQMIGFAPVAGTPNPILSYGGIVIVMGLHHAPMVMLTLFAGFKAIPMYLIEAAQLDGARPARIMRQIVFPLMSGHLAASATLAFVAALGNFGIPALLGLPINLLTLPTLIYRQLSSFGPSVIADVASLSVLLALISAIAILASARLLAAAPPLESEHAIKPFWRLQNTRPVVESFAASMILLVLILPMLSLAMASLVPAYGMQLGIETLTFRAYGEVLLRQDVTLEAFRTSFSLAGAAAVLLACVSVPMSFAINRFAKRSRGLLLFLIDMPYGLPGIVIAIATILLFLRPLPVLGFSIYGTPFIILFAYLARFLALAVKPVAATFQQIPPAIEEAGALCGAGFFTRLHTLIIPQLLPAIAAGAVLVFLTAFNELTVSALLWSSGTRTLGVVLYGFEEAGLTTEASALGIVTIIVVGLLMLIIDRLKPYLPEGVVPWSVTNTNVQLRR